MKTFYRFLSGSYLGLCILAISGGIFPGGYAQTTLMTESFENGGSVPTGWVTEVVSGANTLSFPTFTSWPAGYTAYDGTYLVMFNSFSASGGVNRLKMTTPVRTIGYNSVTVDFAWLESSGYAGVNDHVDVQYSTDGTTWNTAGTFLRYNTVEGWKIKSQVLPPDALGNATLYFAFLFTSAYGNDCYLDFTHITAIAPPLSQPQYYNYNTGGSGSNSFPFNIAGGKDIQLLYLPGDFNQPTPAPAGYITSVSFRISDIYPLGPWTYTDFTIKMGQSAITSFADGSFYAPLTTVYYKASVSLIGVAGQWMTINLDLPFEYDPSQSLIVDIGQCGVPGATGFSACYTNLTGSRRNWSVGGCPFVYSVANTSIYHLGLNIESVPVLYNNGPLFNSYGTGDGGANESIYYQGGTGTFGSGCQYSSGIYLADDFMVPSGRVWSVASMNFYAYQTNSTNLSTITGIYVRIWNGKPGEAGSGVIWGNLTTNRFESSSFTNVYRVLAANGGASRPCMKVIAKTPGLMLTSGSYWVEWSCVGTVSLSGPWAPPVVTQDNVTGNAVQTNDYGVTYNDVLYNNYAQGFPFLVNGYETIVPFMIIQNYTVPSGQTNCFNATQTISVAGNGTAFVVENGASATMIAGQNIQYNPGTAVQEGGYLWGYIAPAGPYCATPLMPFAVLSEMPSAAPGELPSIVRNETELSVVSDQSSFNIYPNPTTGNFLVELKGDIPPDELRIDVYGIRGEKVFSSVLKGVHKHMFSLSDMPAGVYFIRLTTGDKAETGKIIKQ